MGDMGEEPRLEDEVSRLAAEIAALRERLAALERQAGLATSDAPPAASLDEVKECARTRAAQFAEALASAAPQVGQPTGRSVAVPATSTAESKPARNSETPAVGDMSAAGEQESSANVSPPLPAVPAVAPVPVWVPPAPEPFEVRLAKVFVYIGITALAVGFFFAAREYSIGPWSKILAGYVASLALLAGGLLREKAYPRWAQPLVGAGLALSYFTTYAAGFIPATRVVPSLNAALGGLAVNVAVIFAVAHLRRSEVTAGVALLLGYFTAAISQSSAHALWSLGALSAGAVLFMWLNRWFYASLLAVVAAYAGHFYAWKYMPPPPGLETAEVFRVNAAFLSTYFAVFTLGSLASLRCLIAPAQQDGLEDSAPARVLALVTRVNTGFYVAGMVLLLGVTEIYWTKSCYFFFALSAVTALLSTFYGVLPAVRDFHILAASLLFGFGLVSSLSSAWLPLALTVQAVGMLAASPHAPGRAMVLASVVAFIYAAIHLVLTSIYPGMTLGFVPAVRPEWWTVMGAVAVQLAYVGLWSRRLTAADDEAPVASHLFGLVAAISLTVSLHHVAQDLNTMLLAAAIAAPVVAVVGARLQVPGFMTFAAVAVLAYLWGVFAITTARKGAVPGLADHPLWTLGLAGLAAGYAVERLASAVMRSRTWAVASLYLATSISLSLLMRDWQQSYLMLGLAAQALVLSGIALGIGSGWLMGASLLPAALCIGTVGAIRDGLRTLDLDPGRWEVLLSSLILTLVCFVVGSVPRRVRASRGELMHWSVFEVLLLLATGPLVVLWARAAWPQAVFLPLAVYPLVLMLGAVALRRHAVVCVSLLYVAVVLVSFSVADPLTVAGAGDTAARIRFAWFSILTTLIIVLTERVFAWRRQLALVDRHVAADFVAEPTARFVDVVLPTLTAVMLVLSARVHPAVREVLFTAASVLTGFLWVGLGLAFGSRSYRFAGFAVICFGIVKAFMHDIQRLENIYKIVSFVTLGAILITVAYLYSRFRGRLRV